MKETSRHKQIREMAQIIRDANSVTYPEDYFIGDAKLLYRAGYRKASDVAREIFSDIANMCTLHHGFNEMHIVAHIDFELLKELKKKYTEGVE